MSIPKPFTLRVSDDDIADLRERLARTRFPDQAPNTPWAYGTDLGYLRDLVAYWRDSFDWRTQEARLNAFPQFTVPLHGIDLHYLQVPGQGPDPKPLLLLHGWPGSVFEFVDIIPRHNWGKMMMENATDIGFLQMDSRRRQLIFEGDRERYWIPVESILEIKHEFWAEAPPHQPHSTPTLHHLVVASC